MATQQQIQSQIAAAKQLNPNITQSQINSILSYANKPAGIQPIPTQQISPQQIANLKANEAQRQQTLKQQTATTLSPQQLQNLKINNQQQQAQKQQTTQTTQPVQPKQQTTTQPTSPTQPTTKVATQTTQQPSFEDYVKQQTGKTTQELNTLNGSQSVIDITKAYNAQYPATQQNAPQTSTYQVKSGDTLSAIARANGVSIDEISGYRSNDPNLIFPGEQLTIKKYTPPAIEEAGTTPKVDPNTGATTIVPADDPANKYNTDTGELNPNYEPPLTDTQKGYAAHLAENTQAFIYDQIKQELGLDDLKTSPAETSKAIQAVEDEKSAKIADINSNPWLSDGQRLASLRRNEAKFAGRLQNLEDQLSREQKLYQDGVAEAQWKSKLIVDQFNSDRNFYYQAKKDAAELAQQAGTTQLKEQLLEAQIGATRALETQRLTPPSISPTSITPSPETDLTPDEATDPFIKTLLNSEGGKRLTDTSVQKLDKAFGVLDQVGVLQNNIQDVSTGPIIGIFKEKNPWDTKAQTIKAQLNAIVPNLARGVFGEVGVLTDNDIKNYSQTLPNLKSTEDVRNAILGITVDMISKSLKRTLEVNAANKADVSGYVGLYNEMTRTRDGIFDSINKSQQVDDAYNQYLEQSKVDSGGILGSIKNFLGIGQPGQSFLFFK